MALYIQANCRNERAVVLGAGFTTRRSRTPIGMLERPENVTVEGGPYPGSVRLRVNKIHGAKTYFFEYTPAPVADTPSWVLRSTTTRTCMIENLTSGKQYAFRVAGVGTSPARVYSDVVSRFVH